MKINKAPSMHFSIPRKATHTHFYIVILLIIFVSIFSNSFTFAQTSDIEKLYKKAIKEKQPQIRLNKLNEVIGLDPTHTEALIEMGNIYKSQKNYRLAEYYYILAKNSSSEDLKDQIKIELNYNLATTYEHNGKFRLYEETLREILNFQISNVFRSKVNFELGNLYYKQSRYENALIVLNETKNLVADDKTIYANLIAIIEKTQSLEKMYAQAEQDQLEGNLEQARALFEEINKITPGFKNVTTKLRSIEATIHRPQNITQTKPSQKDDRFETTKSDDKEINIRNDIPQEEPKSFDQNDNVFAKIDNEDVIEDSIFVARETSPQDTTINEKLLSETQPEIQTASDINTEILSQSFQIELDSLYKRGLNSIESKKWLDATIDFEILQNLNRNYRNSDSLLSFAKLKLHEENTAKIPQGSTSSPLSYFFLGVTAIFILPVIGFVFSPDVRAQYYLIRKDYYAAASIYEKIISRNATRKKVYPKLAHIYLLSGRVDKTAIQVYKKALQLSMNNNQRDKIASLVMQKYLQEGHSDKDAIEVLEKVLKQEVVKR